MGELALLLSLATWRVTSLLYDESAFGWLRKRLGIEETGGVTRYPDNFLGDLWGCFWCLSLVVAGIAAAAMTPLAHLPAWRGVLLWLAAAAGAVVVEKWIGRSKARW